MPSVPASPHADHDRLLVAAYAAGDATGADLEAARTLVASCADCAVLHRDLRVIAAALPALPAPVRPPRDFRLTSAQAAGLRPPTWRRLLEPFAGPRFAFAGPLGTGLATLGIAGLLVAGSLGAPLAATAPTAGGVSGPEAAGEPVDGSGAVSTESEAPAFVAPAQVSAPSASAEAAPDVLQAPRPSARPGDDRDNTIDHLRSPGDEAPVGAPHASGVDDAAAAGSPLPELASPGRGLAGLPGASDASGLPTAAEAPLPPARSSSIPLLVLAGLMLATGIGLSVLRLAARRLA